MSTHNLDGIWQKKIVMWKIFSVKYNILLKVAQSTGAAEYTDCISAGG